MRETVKTHTNQVPKQNRFAIFLLICDDVDQYCAYYIYDADLRQSRFTEKTLSSDHQD